MVQMLPVPRVRTRRWLEVINDPADDRSNLGDHTTADRARSCPLSSHICWCRTQIHRCLTRQCLPTEIGGGMNESGMYGHSFLPRMWLH